MYRNYYHFINLFIYYTCSTIGPVQTEKNCSRPRVEPGGSYANDETIQNILTEAYFDT